MEKYNIYEEISKRSQGDIYIGVVGPVRTGKSTLIKRFMDLLIIPNIDNEFIRERARDELPQSSTGRTIMTTEPKFVPNEAAPITLDSNVELKIRFVDCVGYLVDGALGHSENDVPRMVSTPWFDHQVPFSEAAELGTKKVINEHSTIGIVVTTDGSITGIPKQDYSEAEERVIKELKQINKPFVIVLNSTRPDAPETLALRDEMQQKYQVPVINVSCIDMRIEEIHSIMEKVLTEFPISEIGVNIPRWVESLDDGYWLKVSILDSIKNSFKDIRKIREVKERIPNFKNYDFIRKTYIDKVNMGEGKILIEINTKTDLFYRTLSETSGLEIEGEDKLIHLMKDLARIKTEYEKVEYALHEARTRGYGVVTPLMEELSLEEPEIIKHGNRFAVRLKANAPSLHLIKANIETEIAPLVGTEKQSEELVNYLLKEFETNPSKIWESNIFGKSLHDLVNEGLQNKLYKMPEDAQLRLKDTLERIINEGSGGLICIIL